jgi:hypothetical protein
MALTLQFFFVEGTQAEVIVMDAALSEQHSFGAEVTEFPVEDGSNINDNVRPLPFSLRIDGFLSDFPLEGIAKLIPSSSIIPRQTKGPKRSQNELEKLIKLRDQGRPIKVTTGLKIYENMVVESIDVSRDKSTASGIKLSLSLRQIKIVRTQTAKLIAAENIGQNTVTEGPQAGKEATPEEASRSYALTLKDGLGEAGTIAKEFFGGLGLGR